MIAMLSPSPGSSAALLSEVSDAAHGSSTQRFEYWRRSSVDYLRIIVDVDASGHQEWSDQEPGEVRWYPHTPSDEERQMLKEWIESGQPPTRWPFVAVRS